MYADNIFDCSTMSSSDNYESDSMTSTNQAIVNGDLGNGTTISPSKFGSFPHQTSLPNTQNTLISASSSSTFEINSVCSQDLSKDLFHGQGVKQRPTNDHNPSLNANKSKFPPSNITNNVILIEPRSLDEVIMKKFLNNDLHIAKGLKNSLFNNAVIESVNKNRARNLLVVKVKNADPDIISSLLEITHLGDYEVCCKLPSNKAKSIGVIGPIGIETPLNELQEEIINGSQDVDKIERIYKGKEKTPTMSVKVFFNKGDLPQHIHVAYQRFKVSTYVGIPWQYYRCQGFGHNAAHCRFKPRCLVCAGPHLLKECNQKVVNNKITNVKCSNCKGDHAANYGGCPFFKEAKQVEQIRAQNQVSYRDAVKLQKDNKNKESKTQRFPLSSAAYGQSNASNIMTAAAVANPTRNLEAREAGLQIYNMTAKKQCSTISTQTESSSTSSSQTNSDIVKGLAIIIANLFDNNASNKTISKENILHIFNERFQLNLDQSDLNNTALTETPSSIPETQKSLENNVIPTCIPETQESQENSVLPSCIPETQESQENSETDWTLVASPKNRKRKKYVASLSPCSKGEKCLNYLYKLGAATRSQNQFEKKK